MRTIKAGICILMICSLQWAATAAGKEVHVYSSSFGSKGTGIGQFNTPLGVAVDDVTHDVYVVDSGNDRVQKFDATGSTVLCEFDGSPATEAFQGPTEIAVDNSGNALDPSNEDVYVVDRGHGVIDKFDSSCAYLGHITASEAAGGPFTAGEASKHAITGMAVDAGGALWVGLREGPLYEFGDQLVNTLVAEVETNFGGATPNLSVDGKDDIYFGRGQGKVVKVTSLGETVENPFCGSTEGFKTAINPVGGEVYLNGRERIETCDVTGEAVDTFGVGLLAFSSGVGVDASTNMVYVTDAVADKVLIFEGVTLPTVKLGSPSEQTTTSLTLNGTVNPEGKEVTSCVFEYDTTAKHEFTGKYQYTTPCVPPSLAAGNSAVPVSAHLNSLLPQTEYSYRLVAENSAHVPSSENKDFFTGPLLVGEFAQGVAASSASLLASLDPNGIDTRYYVEYGPTSAYGLYAPASPPGVDAGAIVGAQALTVHLQSLEPGSVYHYRFVAIADGEEIDGGDRVFATETVGSAGLLLDGRAWEMVSPANKKGALIELTEQGGQVQAASDGSGVTYITQGSHVGDNPVGHVTYTQTLSSRTAGGWKSLDLTLPGRLPENGEPALSVGQFQFEYRGFSPDLGSGVVEPQIAGTPPLSPNVSERTLYLWNSAIGSFLPIVTPENVFPIGRNIEEPQASTDFALHFLAMSPNAQHIVFRTPLALTEEAIQEETLASHVPVQIQWNLYEWSGGKLQLVNVLPNGKVAHGPYPAVPPVRLAGMTNVNGLGRGGGQHDVSSNGRWVAWTWGEPYTSEQLASYRGLYVRDTTEEVTTRVGGTDAVFQTMTEDGSGVFYLEKGDLYEFDTETGLTTDLTGNHAPGESGEVQEAVSDISRDGAYAYFVANRDLASGGVDGQNNLYVSHRTGTEWATSYIATLSAQDKPTWYAETFNVPFLARISARTSPNGRYLAFMSNMPLTGYDNTDAVSGMADEEVFEYDAVKGLLACASCDPTGARPAGVLDTPGSELLVDRGGVWTSKETTEKDLHVDHWLAGSVPGWDNLNNNPATYQPRYLSDNGRLFFDSPVGLVAQDTNGLEDVYEFEPEGVGDCVSGEPPFSTMLPGCVSLMSSGTASAESAFYDASEGGDDVFFTTTGKLSGEDYDRGYDVYDAHVCTSAAPCDDVTKGTVGPCSSGDACKGAPTPQPDIFGPVSSATFSGGGNVIPGSVQTRVASRAQKLARAVRLCRRKKTVRRRTLCIRAARKRYGVTPAQRTVTGRRERRSN